MVLKGNQGFGPQIGDQGAGEFVLKKLDAAAGRDRCKHLAEIALLEPGRAPGAQFPLQNGRQEGQPVAHPGQGATGQPVKDEEGVAFEQGAVEVEDGYRCRFGSGPGQI